MPTHMPTHNAALPMTTTLQTRPFSLTASDGQPIDGHVWRSNSPPRALLQIAHGLGEHALRYRPLAEAFAAQGWAVLAHHHRGHGPRARALGNQGDLGTRGFAGLVDDLAQVSAYARTGHPGLPLVLLGHSMGSFAVQCCLPVLGHRLAGAVLSGSAAVDLMQRPAGWTLQDANAGLPDPRTAFDWLSRDAAQVDAYIADPLCGFSLTLASRSSMVAACAALTDTALLARIPAALPLYLFTGDQDPVNRHLDWFWPLVTRYKAAGLQDVSLHVYGGGRHEMLNETNRDEVTAQLIAWCQRAAGLDR